VPKGRPVRKVVRKVDVASVLRLSFMFWLAVVTAVLLAGVVVWAAAGMLGVFSSMSEFMASLGITHFRVHGWAVLGAAAVLGAVFVAWATLTCGFLAVLYNAASGVIGGLELVLIDGETAEPAMAVTSAGSAVIARSPVSGSPIAAAAEVPEPLSPGIGVS
jgi:hypothetical protein